jgi:hypothetical protein
MRALLAALLACMLVTTMIACGGSLRESSTAASQHRKKDRDNDEDNNDDDQHVFAFGRPAGPSDEYQIRTLVQSYFAAAADANGATACKLLTPFVAETVAERWGHTRGLSGNSCPVVMGKLFKEHRALLAGKRRTLVITRVGVEGDRSLVALEFSSIHEARQVTARRAEGKWTMLTLLDGIIE